jgi:hypothetical protein
MLMSPVGLDLRKAALAMPGTYRPDFSSERALHINNKLFKK